MNSLYNFAYISKLNSNYDVLSVNKIIKTSRINNALNHITGLLVFDGENFFQYVEGEEFAVKNLIEKIKADDRHIEICTLLEGHHHSERYYNQWKMAYAYLEDNSYLKTLMGLDKDEIFNKIFKIQKEFDFEP